MPRLLVRRPGLLVPASWVNAQLRADAIDRGLQRHLAQKRHTREMDSLARARQAVINQTPAKPKPVRYRKERDHFTESWAMRRARTHDRAWKAEREPCYSDRLAEGFAMMAGGDE